MLLFSQVKNINRFRQDLMMIAPKAEEGCNLSDGAYSAIRMCMMSQADLVTELPGPKMADTPAL